MSSCLSSCEEKQFEDKLKEEGSGNCGIILWKLSVGNICHFLYFYLVGRLTWCEYKRWDINIPSDDNTLLSPLSSLLSMSILIILHGLQCPCTRHPVSPGWNKKVRKVSLWKVDYKTALFNFAVEKIFNINVTDKKAPALNLPEQP